MANHNKPRTAKQEMDTLPSYEGADGSATNEHRSLHAKNIQSRRVLLLAERLAEARGKFSSQSVDKLAYREEVSDREIALRELMERYSDSLPPEVISFVNGILSSEESSETTAEILEADSTLTPEMTHAPVAVNGESKADSSEVSVGDENIGRSDEAPKSSALTTSPDEIREEVDVSENLRTTSDPTDSGEAIGSTRPLDAIDADQVKRAYEFMQDTHVPTGSRFWNGKEQRLRVTITKPMANLERLSREEWERRELGSTAMRLVKLNAFTDEANRPDGTKWRDAYQALENDIPVVSINSQGVETPSLKRLAKTRRTRLTLRQVKSLLKGTFTDTGKSQYEAFKNATGSEGDIYLHAASKGVADAAGFIRAAVEDGAGERLKGVVLHEGVNYKKRHLGKLALQFFTKGGDANKAHHSNPELMQKQIEGLPKWVGRVTMSAVANALYGQALSKGKFLSDLGDPNELAESAPNLNVVLANGSESVLSPTKDNDEVKKILEDAGINVRHIVIEGGNHTDTMNEQIAARLNATILNKD